MAAAERSQKRRDIQQLRALAVLAVSLEHCGYVFAKGGFIGVDIFFVISGYLILGKLNDEYQATGKINFGQFWTRRILRLAPASAIVLAATALFVWIAKIDYFTFTRALKDAAWASASLLNIEYLIDGNDYWSDAVTSPLIHFWSLGVEEQFYVAASTGFLLLGIFTRKRGPVSVRPIFIIIGIATMVALYFELQANTVSAFYNPIGRGWEFAIGGLIAAGRPNPDKRLTKVLSSPAVKLLSWSGLIAACVLITPEVLWPGPLTGLVALLTAGVLYRAHPKEQPRTWVPAAKPLSTFTTWMGDISYSMYLWHWPVLVLGGWLLSRTMQDPRAADPFRNFMLLEIAMLLAAASERLVERPIINRGRLPKAGRLAQFFFLVCYANGTIIFSQLYQLPPAITVNAGNSKPVVIKQPGAQERKFTTAEIEAAAIKAQEGSFAPGCVAHFEDKSVPSDWEDICTLGTPTAKNTIVLLGDSHAHQWLPALDALGKKHKFKVIAYTKSSCPYVAMTVPHPRASRGYTECDSWNRSVFKKLQANPNISGIVVGRALSYGRMPGVRSEWKPGWRNSLSKLLSVSKNIVVLGDNPESPTRMTSCVLSNLADPTRCNIPVLKGIQPDDRLLSFERPIARQLGMNMEGFVSTRDIVCQPVVCNAVTPKGNVLMRQGSHISAPAALEYADALWLKIKGPLGLDTSPAPTASPSVSPTVSPSASSSPTASPSASASP